MNKTFFLFGIIFILSITSCQTASPDTVDARSVPQATVIAGIAPPRDPTYPLGTISYSMTGASPDYVINVETPGLRNSSTPNAENFGRAVTQVIQDQIQAFKQDLKNVPASSNSGSSSLDISYTLVYQKGSIFSLQIKISESIQGAAHPTSRTEAFNYDVSQGRQINLDQLFIPGSNYLQAIANYCKQELTSRAIGFDATYHGADPTVENYHSWNVSKTGLVITFDESQVAPYTAGLPVVVVPYNILTSMIDPKGPIADLGK